MTEIELQDVVKKMLLKKVPEATDIELDSCYIDKSTAKITFNFTDRKNGHQFFMYTFEVKDWNQLREKYLGNE